MEENMSIDIRYAECLAEVYEHVGDICKIWQKPAERPLIWFRGHEYEYYNLEPNLFRKADYRYNTKYTYGINHLREDYRFQSFMSRNFDKIETRMPQTEIEWQEVMQHFFTQTRLMDWSESLTVALQFALEPFIKPVVDLEVTEHKRTATPAIWVLKPTELNKKVYQAFAHNHLISKALSECFPKGYDQVLERELKSEEKSGLYFSISGAKESNLNAMISLSSLEIIRNAYRGWEEKALESLEWNPFFFLILRYYSDGVPVELGKLPPLAIIHPYHSQRIRAQRGVFTVFPHYIPDHENEWSRMILNERPAIAMEYMKQCIPYLYKINILDPQRVAYELMATGAKRSNLYPGMQEVSQDFENVVR